MRNIRSAIVDDEPVARKILQEFVGKTPYLTGLGSFEHAHAAAGFLQDNAVDLLFVDIDMPGVSGLEFVKSLSVKPMIIITTAFPEYALDGYALDVMDYLLKPISYGRFVTAVKKAKDYHDLKDLAGGNGTLSYLFVRCEKRIEKLELNDILYIESAGNYVHIHLAHKTLIAYLTLKSIEAQLPLNDFVKTHQSFLVNFSKITAIEGNQVVLGDKFVPVSRNYREEIMSVIEKRMLKR